MTRSSSAHGPIDTHRMRDLITNGMPLSDHTWRTTMTDLVEHIRRLLDHHRIDDQGNTADVGCSCGEASLPNHSRHVAQQIVDSLCLRKEAVGTEIRYVSAWFDDELTKLEGAE
jgi:hypothetical protein